VIEIHTGAWCEALAAHHGDRAAAELERIRAGAKRAHGLGLEVHAGHGLDYVTAETIAGLPELAELNIGHFIVGEAIFGGLEAAVRRMRRAMDPGPAGSRGPARGAGPGRRIRTRRGDGRFRASRARPKSPGAGAALCRPQAIAPAGHEAHIPISS